MEFLRECFLEPSTEYLRELNWICRTNSDFIRGFLQGFGENTLYNFCYLEGGIDMEMHQEYEKLIQNLLRMNGIGTTNYDNGIDGGLMVNGLRSRKRMMELMDDAEIPFKLGEKPYLFCEYDPYEIDHSKDEVGQAVVLEINSITHTKIRVGTKEYVNDFSVSFNGYDWMSPVVLI